LNPSRRDHVIFEQKGQLFCEACNRNLGSLETQTAHVHDFQKYNLTEPIDLAPLKRYTSQLIAASRKPERAGEQGDSDLIDWTIINVVEAIDRNPKLATTGSCSGHDGFPFITIVFRESIVRDCYLAQVKRQGFRTILSDYYRMGFFSMNYPEVKVREEWSILPAEDRDYPIDESRKFWKDWQRVLTKLPPRFS
jgi:hypothetical protein